MVNGRPEFWNVHGCKYLYSTLDLPDNLIAYVRRRGKSQGPVAAAHISLTPELIHVSLQARPCPQIPARASCRGFLGLCSSLTSQSARPSTQFSPAADPTHLLFSWLVWWPLSLILCVLWVCSSFVCFTPLLSLWWDSRRQTNNTPNPKFLSIKFETVS